MCTSFILNRDLGNYQPKGNYATANHNHDGVYQPAGSYATTTHYHDDRYYVKSEIDNALAGAVIARTYGTTTAETAPCGWAIDIGIDGYVAVGYSFVHGMSAVTILAAEGWSIGCSRISGFSNYGNLNIGITVIYVKRSIFR